MKISAGIDDSYPEDLQVWQRMCEDKNVTPLKSTCVILLSLLMFTEHNNVVCLKYFVAVTYTLALILFERLPPRCTLKFTRTTHRIPLLEHSIEIFSQEIPNSGSPIRECLP